MGHSLEMRDLIPWDFPILKNSELVRRAHFVQLSVLDYCQLDLYWMTEAELKHCRIAMLAVVGALAQELGFVFPGNVRICTTAT